MYNEVITLVAEEFTVNEYGDRVPVQTRRQVFAKLVSIGMSEFYQAQAVNLKPELKFVLPDFLEYHGELVVEYQPFEAEPEVFTVLRTYRNGYELELVCKKGLDHANT